MSLLQMQDDDGLQIVLPHEYVARPYQDPLWQAAFPKWYGLDREPAKRYVLVWHRRAGKDKTSINLITAKASEEIGNYLYMLPEQTQARKVIWQGIGSDGMRFIDHIPAALIRKKYSSDMLIELINGSTIQLGGADSYDSWMGTNPRGIIFSEYSLQNPQAWNYFRPILTENGGWAVFIYTARGHNHGFELNNIAKREMEKNNEEWFYGFVTVDDSKREDGTPVITQEDIQKEIEAGMPPEMVQQEFYCSFDSGNMGAYYSDLLQGLRNRNPSRIGHYPYDPRYPVITAWDLGIHDATSIWFAQQGSGGPHIIDYYEERNVSLVDHIKFVLDKPYSYSEHLAPHDIMVREKSSGITLLDIARDRGLDFTVMQRDRIDDGIENVRVLLPRCTFDEERCHDGIESLMGYERTWDARLKTFRDRPLHNWASHGADAFRVLATGWFDLDEMEAYHKPKVNRSIR